MNRIWIEDRKAYDFARRRGVEPLIDRRYKLPIALRVEIQRDLFGRGHKPSENEKFYRWCWAHLPHVCEETMKPLYAYSAVYVSHILSRGAHPEMAHDPRNVNILSWQAHARWENGDRENMRIYRKNLATIEELRREYEDYDNGVQQSSTTQLNLDL